MDDRVDMEAVSSGKSAGIKVLDEKSDKFQVLEEYVRNTHRANQSQAVSTSSESLGHERQRASSLGRKISELRTRIMRRKQIGMANLRATRSKAKGRAI